MNIVKTNAIRQIESKKYSYELYEYDAPDGFLDGVKVSKQIGKPREMVFKTLVTHDGKGEYYICIIPVEKELDLKLAAKAFGVKKIDMIAAKDITKITGYIKGGCSPIGMKKPYRTSIDIKGKSLDKIVVSGGRVGLQVELKVKDLAALTKAEFDPITVE